MCTLVHTRCGVRRSLGMGISAACMGRDDQSVLIIVKGKATNCDEVATAA